MKKQLLILLLMFFNITTCYAYSDSLVVIDIKLDKTQYLSGQTIWCETHIKNISKNELVIAYDDYLNDPKREPAKYILAGDPQKGIYSVLPESVLIIGPRSKQLSQYIQNDSNYIDYPPNQCSICCSLDIYKKADAGRIKDRGIRSYPDMYAGYAKPIESITDSIYIDVIVPSEQEKAVLNGIILYKQKQREKYDADVQVDIKKLIDNYPKSAYAPQCLYDYIMAARTRNREEFVLAVKRFFNDYSDSKYIGSVSHLLLVHYEGLRLNYSQAKRELNNLKEQYKTNENVVKIIDKLITQLKGKFRYN